MESYSNERMQAMILDAFKFTKEFLDRHNLRYIASCGTVLGAVRHHGFIPWDDDMDIYMPRKDYNKLLELNNEMLPYGYEILSPKNDGFYCPYAKISHLKSTLWEVKYFPLVIGVFIDIFPLDEFQINDEDIVMIQKKSRTLWSRYINAISCYEYKEITKNLLYLKFRTVKIQITSKIRSSRKEQLFAKFRAFEDTYTCNSGEKCVCISLTLGHILKTRWFEDVIEVPFEDTTVIIPKEYDAYLKLLYGDYMTPPPPEKRVSVHSHYFVDLNRRLTIDEIKGIMRK